MRDDLVPLLDRHLKDFRELDFAYGKTDCVQFVGAWLSLLGIEANVPSYSSMEEGEQILASLGHRDWCAAVSAVLEPRAVMRARIGDIVAHSANRALGVCVGGPRAVFLGGLPGAWKGLHFSRLDKCCMAWSVDP